jgi:anti-sigma regulatory factor (Ser/Thr protein kinase)
MLRSEKESMRLFQLHTQVKLLTFQMMTLALDKLSLKRNHKKQEVAILSTSEAHVHLAIRSHITLIEPVVAYLHNRMAQFCHAHHLQPVNLDLCLQEALANAIVHGNLAIPSALKEESWEQFEALVWEREALPEFADRQVTIRCQLSPQRMTIEVEDQGAGFEMQDSRNMELASLPATEDHAALKLLSGSGRGLVFIQAFMDQVVWNATGNCITMIKNFSTA